MKHIYMVLEAYPGSGYISGFGDYCDHAAPFLLGAESLHQGERAVW
jgi:hypothetical protein